MSLKEGRKLFSLVIYSYKKTEHLTPLKGMPCSKIGSQRVIFYQWKVYERRAVSVKNGI